jgi:hypothetical protein
MSPAYALAQYLAAHGYGIWADDNPVEWSINVALEPEVPDRTITLLDDGGGDPDTDELDIQEARVNIRVRGGRDGPSYLTTLDKCEQIRDALTQPAPLVAEGVCILGARLIGAIANLGRDTLNRSVMMMTFMVQVQR